MKIADIKIGIRLAFLAGFLLLGMLIVGMQGWHMLAQSTDRSSIAMQRASRLEASVDAARSAQVQFKIQVQEWKNTLLRGGDAPSFQKYKDAFVKEGELTQANLNTLKLLLQQLGLNTAPVDEAVGAHRELVSKYLDALKKYDSADPASAHVVDGMVKGMDREPTKKIDDIVAFVLQQSKRLTAETVAEAARASGDANIMLVCLMALALGLGSAVTYWLVHSITVPLNTAVRIAQSVAAGDLDSELKATSRDETGQLLKALGEMNHSLVAIVTEVRTGSDAIANATTEIASGNLDLSSRTEEQASSLEETAASMEELTSTVKQNAANATEASSLANAAQALAVKGGGAVADVVQTMDSINASSKKIVDIISVIDGIAFQTNILALNAAVEAARAGEQGRGFAVVASEVRNLAQRSAAAAKEIKTLIGDSVEQVATGTRMVGAAGSTMEEVVASVKRVTDIIVEIAAASREQTAGIEQVNVAITQMDSVTQQNAALVEQAAAAAEAMQHQASSLSKSVGVFKIDGAGGAAPARLGGPAPRLGGRKFSLPA